MVGGNPRLRIETWGTQIVEVGVGVEAESDAALGAEFADGFEECAREEGDPGEEPEQKQQPEEWDGDVAVVVRDATAEEARDVLVVEIEPGPPGVGGQTETRRHGDGRVAQRGEDVPRSGDQQEERGGCQQVESGEQAQVAGECQVEQDEAQREDDADESLGEQIEGSDRSEAEHGRERGVAVADAVERDEEEVHG